MQLLRTAVNRVGKSILCAITATAIVLGGVSLAAPIKGDTAEKAYQDARKIYYRVLGSTRLREDPKNWERIIDRYESIVNSYPRSRRVPYALYMAARCSARLYKDTHNTSFLLQSIRYFSRLAGEFPGHHLADDALYYTGKYYQKLGNVEKAARAYLRVMENYSSGDFYARAREQFQRLPKKFEKLEENYKDALNSILALPLGKDLKRRWKTAAERFGNHSTIVIDPGHGGKDPGAIGPRGLKEKDVVLKIGHFLADKLRKLPNVKVVMTRTRDRFLSLAKRAAIANNNGAELFVSIHLNAIADPSFSGVETYFLNLTNDPRSLAVAAKENATTKENLSDLQLILMDLLNDSKIKESSRLAEIVHGEFFTLLSRRMRGVSNLGVKQAPFYVLLGAQMPCIMVEVAFISNPVEERRLRSRDYLNLLAEGIYKGIKAYMERVSVAYR
ncbi:MAG: N-acetylmuramoyl-L-alanine amidase [Deltaproteobacteria bacterium]|nr:N-acetylmuramoyl-L-alanine amidase [Deltaproteobacteria bacterium]